MNKTAYPWYVEFSIAAISAVSFVGVFVALIVTLAPILGFPIVFTSLGNDVPLPLQLLGWLTRHQWIFWGVMVADWIAFYVGISSAGKNKPNRQFNSKRFWTMFGAMLLGAVALIGFFVVAPIASAQDLVK